MITKAQLEEMFDGVHDEPGWDLDSPLVWDYFFTDTDREKLIRAAATLESLGYEVVGLLEPGPDEDDKEILFLQVRKVEHHTIDTLDARNQELYRFADEHDLKSYDGMDMSRLKNQDDGV